MPESPMGKLIVLSGPSGVGKSSVVKALIGECPLKLRLSVSATTRPARPDEVDGQDYFFIDKNEFQRRQANGEFIECAEVFHVGDWYGTLRQPVEKARRDGYHVILEIDVEGALQVMRQYPEAITVFIHPGSLEELERRLRGRKTETEERLQARLAVAAGEIELSVNYDHVVVNDEIAVTAQRICHLLQQKLKGESESCTTN